MNSSPQGPLSQIPVPQPIVDEYFERLKKHEDELGIVLKTHLLVEYLLNTIIKERCKSPEKILKDHRSFPFSVKLQIVYSMGLLPEFVFKNIAKLNGLRNEFAHNLSVRIQKIDRKYFGEDGEEKTLQIRRQRNPDRHYLKIFTHYTL